MAKKIRNGRGSAVENTGFGTQGSSRYFNKKTGKPYVKQRGYHPLRHISWYHTLIEMSVGKFLLLMFATYIFVNLLFAGLYYIIGIQHLAGIQQGSNWHNFLEVFFFSTQTFTTVGYGRISPMGFVTSAIATFEAFLGLLSFAIATGLFYGRFSRPQAYLKFSEKALISPYQEGTALMLRMAPYKNNSLSDGEAKLTLAMVIEEENGKSSNRFFSLPLTLSYINSLSLSWTLVHVINEESPLYGMDSESLKNAQLEVMVFVKAFDNVFSNTVVQQTSYQAYEIVYGAKYKLMYHNTDNKEAIILDFDKLNDYELVPIKDLVIQD